MKFTHDGTPLVPNAPELVSGKIAQQITGFGPTKMWSLRKSGAIKFYRFGPRTIKYDLADLLAYIASARV